MEENAERGGGDLEENLGFRSSFLATRVVVISNSRSNLCHSVGSSFARVAVLAVDWLIASGPRTGRRSCSWDLWTSTGTREGTLNGPWASALNSPDFRHVMINRTRERDFDFVLFEGEGSGRNFSGIFRMIL